MTDAMDKAGSLKAQDPIYLGEDRYEEPKELFKVIAAMIEAAGHGAGTRAIDVGCATGEFIHYLGRRFPQWEPVEGVDISEAMVARAQQRVPGARFRPANLLHPKDFEGRRDYDVVICSGVLSVFDDLTVPLSNLFALAKPRASVVIATMINSHPIDTIMRYRRTEDADAIWETGWNYFSRQTVERLLGAMPYAMDWTWSRFDMPFAIPARSGDPMRTWTIDADGVPFQTVNGANQLVNLGLLHARLGAGGKRG